MSADAACPYPDVCAVAFKEWEGVCQALLSGRQSLILRKGGIKEGPGGFQPEHNAFWLYPTHVHQAQQGLKPAEVTPRDVTTSPSENEVEVRGLVVVERIGLVEQLDKLEELAPLHVWTAETIEKRFHYRQPGLYVLGVRIYRRDDPWRVPVTAEHAGCKTWVPLGEGLDTTALAPVLDAASHEATMRVLEAVLGLGGRN